ncbi:Kelch repeat-containing protein [Mucilaginibacter sp. Mucisp86]|uniref:Kelch repeat-containing protein n=1 Tax=Mucilaginibacter sp. Mucisp86 TaxID=3243060 RepID=UPI0039B5224D
MRQLWFLLIALFILSCTKKEIKDIQADSFRISILPVVNPAFNQYKLTGTLDVHQTAGNIEYGLVVGKTLNPVVEHEQVFKVGSSSSSIDFTKVIANLDTGFTYYVRAYGKSSTSTEYSANQAIGKLAPKLSLNTTSLQYGQLFSVFTNFYISDTENLPEVQLNNTPVKLIGGVGSGVNSASLTFIPPPTLSPGTYTLSVKVGNISISYPTQLTLLEGTWSQLEYLLPRDYSGVASIPDRYVINNWIYTNQFGNPVSPSSFSRYNYKTGETQTLKALPAELLPRGAAIVQIGNDLHFMGGELIATGAANRPVTKSYQVYHITNDTWTQEPDIPAAPRSNAAVMQVGNRLYYGLGTDPSITSGGGYYTGLNDIWVCDLNTKKWTQLQDFPGKGGFSRAYFIVNAKLYVTGGNGDNGTQVKETWCYDPGTNQWSRKADYPGQGWINLSTFSIGGYGYVGLGETASYNSYFGRNLYPNFYKYNATTDKWTEVSNFGGNLVQPFVGNDGSNILIGAGMDASSVPSRALLVFKP